MAVVRWEREEATPAEGPRQQHVVAVAAEAVPASAAAAAAAVAVAAQAEVLPWAERAVVAWHLPVIEEGSRPAARGECWQADSPRGAVEASIARASHLRSRSACSWRGF